MLGSLGISFSFGLDHIMQTEKNSGHDSSQLVYAETQRSMALAFLAKRRTMADRVIYSCRATLFWLLWRNVIKQRDLVLVDVLESRLNYFFSEFRFSLTTSWLCLLVAAESKRVMQNKHGNASVTFGTICKGLLIMHLICRPKILIILNIFGNSNAACQ